MTALLFEDVRMIDPANGVDQMGRLLVRDGQIIGSDRAGAEGKPEGAEIIEGQGAVLCPGLIDIRVATGEPGNEYSETIASAADAAVCGGVTTMAVLPNTKPAIDDPSLVRLLHSRGEETGKVTVYPYGALTKACAGEEMAELGLLREAGAIAFTDGKTAIASAKRMVQLLTYAQGIGGLIVQHPEEPSLARDGCATRSALATKLGLPQIPTIAEPLLIARDIRLAEFVSARIHFAHVSTAAGLDLIRDAKSRGLAITCDTAPHYFALNEDAILDYRTYAKFSPPLRSEEDRLAVCAALADGTIDAVASDHTPWDADNKRLPFAQAQSGGTGLATLLGVTLEEVHRNNLALIDAIRLLSSSPAKLFGIEGGSLNPGTQADLCLFALDHPWTVVSGALPGQAQNTPFDGWQLRGKVLGTWKNGTRVYDGS